MQASTDGSSHTAPSERVAESPAQPAKRNLMRMEFVGTGGAYFKIWITNLLLIVLTLGIYTPWARVRKIKFFYNHSLVGGAPLEFHGTGGGMWRGTFLIGLFFLLYSYAGGVSKWAGLVAAIGFVVMWPFVYWAGTRFRMANTSWRGLRFGFYGTWQRAVLVAGIPTALVVLPIGLFPFMLPEMADARPSRAASSAAGGFVALALVLAFALALPWLSTIAARYRFDNSRWASLSIYSRFRADKVYWVYLQAAGWAMLVAFLAGLAGALLFPMLRAGLSVMVVLPILAVFGYVAVFVFVWAFLQASLQNHFWSRIGSRQIRFRSNLKISSWMLLSLKNAVLGSITLGMYWPFAAVAAHKMRLEAVHIESVLEFEAVIASAQQPGSAAGDAALDLFGGDLAI